MRVLWISNSAFPEVYMALGQPCPVNTGWVHSAAHRLLSNTQGLSLATAVFMNVPSFQILNIAGITHYLLPNKCKFDSTPWENVLNSFTPDLIHVHGTEYPYLFSFLKVIRDQKIVISIQGLVSVYERYYFGSISIKELFRSITFRDLLRFDSVFTQRLNMFKRGIFEKSVIKSAHAVIGRTEWDKAHVYALNNRAAYYHCNEILRSVFYHRDSWEWEKCQKFRIFISQAHYPIKGLHHVLNALPIVLQMFPQTEVYISGHNIFKGRGIRINGYGNFINRLIGRLNLKNNIHFVGLLSEEEMKAQYLKAHVFICASGIENSPNSLGEAQFLGTPVIASYVGGIPDMVIHGESGLLYRFEEYEMLASYIIKLFCSKEMCVRLSTLGRKTAAIRHEPVQNSLDLFRIYKVIVNQ
jgi:glycosyltransferase involved in cell wall biosynthesis